MDHVNGKLCSRSPDLCLRLKGYYAVRKALQEGFAKSPMELTEAVWKYMRHFPCQWWWDGSRENHKLAILKATTEILAQANQKMIQEVIQGTLPRTARTDKNSKAELESLGWNRTASNPPLVGVYQIYIVDSSGWGLSKDRIEAVICDMRRVNRDFEGPLAIFTGGLRVRLVGLSDHAEIPLSYVGCSQNIVKRMYQHYNGYVSSQVMHTVLTLTRRRFPRSDYHLEGYPLFHLAMRLK
jgi:hypothetical protein